MNPQSGPHTFNFRMSHRALHPQYTHALVLVTSVNTHCKIQSSLRWPFGCPHSVVQIEAKPATLTGSPFAASERPISTTKAHGLMQHKARPRDLRRANKSAVGCCCTLLSCFPWAIDRPHHANTGHQIHQQVRVSFGRAAWRAALRFALRHGSCASCPPGSKLQGPEN